MEIDDRTEYDLLKQKTKFLANKYPIGNQFINYIDECDFLTNSKINVNDKIFSKELTREILLIIKNDTMIMLEKINDFKKYSDIGDLYSLWKIIYIKCFNPILIIGSGVSGLTIASGIKDRNFLILEARERIGGRVFTNDNNLDIGAAWIHGSNQDNPLNKFIDIVFCSISFYGTRIRHILESHQPSMTQGVYLGYECLQFSCTRIVLFEKHYILFIVLSKSDVIT